MTRATESLHPAPTGSAALRPLRLAVVGATGALGRQLCEQAIAAGHQVTALARRPAALEGLDLGVVAGSATDLDAMRRTIRGCDAVVCALGAPALSRSKVRSEGTATLVEAMRREGVERIVCVSLLGAGESRAGLPRWIRWFLFPLYLRRPVAEHERQEAILRESGLDWTAVRPPFLTDGPRTEQYAVGFPNGAPGLTLDISRADVAHLMLQAVVDDSYVGETPGISYRRA